jgi:hypothetical protein
MELDITQGGRQADDFLFGWREQFHRREMLSSTIRRNGLYQWPVNRPTPKPRSSPLNMGIPYLLGREKSQNLGGSEPHRMADFRRG